jgi:FkbM family methyltransferase
MDMPEPDSGTDREHLFRLTPAVSADDMLANMRSAIARNLPQAAPCRAHKRILSVAGGGPSLADTHHELGDIVATVNGSLAFLLNTSGVIREGRHFLCGVCDAGEHIADMLVADPQVRYYIASVCHPKVFEKLRGCDVRLWHLTSLRDRETEARALLDEAYGGYWNAVGGGSTMGLRWVTLGYMLGFRTFHLHGLDSSFRGRATHAYPDRADDREHFEFKGRMTRPNFIEQVSDFFDMMDRFALEDPAVTFRMFGDGLLQDECKPYLAKATGSFRSFAWPDGDREGPMIKVACRELVDAVLPHAHERRTVVQAGGNVGVMPAMLAEHFDHVVTFEPDPDNYACLLQNVPETNVSIYQYALGAASATNMNMVHVSDNCGQSYIAAVPGNIGMLRLDEMDLKDVDLIILDVEGYELEALKGATDTIARCKPVIVVEENGLCERYGVNKGAALDWLADVHGYGVAEIQGFNYILEPQG